MWSKKLRGLIKSTPAISKNAVYVADGSGYVYAFSLNGTLLWQYKTKGAILSSPALVNDTLYVTSADGFIYALKANNGNLIGSLSLRSCEL